MSVLIVATYYFITFNNVSLLHVQMSKTWWLTIKTDL